MNVATSNVIARRNGVLATDLQFTLKLKMLVSIKIRDFYRKYRNKINK